LEGFIRTPARDDECGDFTRGNIDLDRDFQRYAGQNRFRHHVGTTTYLSVGGERVLGFVTSRAV
jgi:hypothetical protein